MKVTPSTKPVLRGTAIKPVHGFTNAEIIRILEQY